MTLMFMYQRLSLLLCLKERLRRPTSRFLEAELPPRDLVKLLCDWNWDVNHSGRVISGTLPFSLPYRGVANLQPRSAAITRSWDPNVLK